MAMLARRLVHHLAERRVAHGAAHAAAVAVRARLGGRACRCARAVARRAVFHARDPELFFFAERRLLEREVEVIADVRAALRDGAALARAPAAAEEHVEDIAKAVRCVATETALAEVEVEPAGAAERVAAEVAGAVERARTELVVLRALLRVFEDFVGRIDLLHLLFRSLRVVAVEIGMILARQFPVGLLDLRIGRPFADPEDLV